ncbi:MAG: type II toxin-antitoxin system Phd/YefM family antitoxin [Terracidiphilus sp.]
MAITTLSSREFDRGVARAKRAARNGPVFITDRGQPAYVLLSIEGYRRLTGSRRSLADALAMPESAEIDFEPPRVGGELSRPADFSTD